MYISESKLEQFKDQEKKLKKHQTVENEFRIDENTKSPEIWQLPHNSEHVRDMFLNFHTQTYSNRK